MRIPTRKPGVYSNQSQDFYVTADKLSQYRSELCRLIERVRPGLASEVHRLSQLGDFSENAEYQLAKGRLRGINHRIDTLRQLIGQAAVIPAGTIPDTVCLGSIVRVSVDTVEKEYHILGQAETDPTRGIISHTSPLGSALMGRRAGEAFSATLGNRTVSCKILSIADKTSRA